METIRAGLGKDSVNLISSSFPCLHLFLPPLSPRLLLFSVSVHLYIRVHVLSPPSYPDPHSLQACALDPMLDDSVMFARRLRDLGQPVTLNVVEDLPHGFLSLAALCRETRQAAELCVQRIRLVLTPPSTPLI